jgi:hypothetical protein
VTDSWLSTFSFQARPFYERLGYRLFGTLENYPERHSLFFVTKRLIAWLWRRGLAGLHAGRLKLTQFNPKAGVSLQPGFEADTSAMDRQGDAIECNPPVFGSEKHCRQRSMVPRLVP